MQFGRQLTITRNNGVSTVSEEIINDFQTVKKTVVCTEIIRVRDDKEILAQFLRLLDSYKAGEIDQIGLQCIRNNQNGSLRIEKTWTIPSL